MEQPVPEIHATDPIALLRIERYLAPGHDPAALGRRMAAVYRCWEARAGLDLVALAAGFLGRLNKSETPIGRVCLQAAAAVADWGGHPYHSAGHHAEVATNAMVLAEIAARLGQPVSGDPQALLLAGALAHDLGYEPAHGPQTRFAAEAGSAEALDVISARNGLPGADREALSALILATEPTSRAVLGIMSSPDRSALDVPAPLQTLTRRPELVGLAAMLSDADLLSSTGLTMGWHRVQLRRLERETGHSISPAEDERFFDRIVGADFLSPGGRYFSANLARIRQGAANV
jgi:hypothetical protein